MPEEIQDSVLKFQTARTLSKMILARVNEDRETNYRKIVKLFGSTYTSLVRSWMSFDRSITFRTLVSPRYW
jgi:hypothetical protein